MTSSIASKLADPVGSPLAGAAVGRPETPHTAGLFFGRVPVTETDAFPPADQGRCWVYVTLNAEIALGLDRNRGLRALLDDPRLRVSVDGQWLWWALRRKYPGRALRKLSGSDLIHELARHCEQRGKRLFLLGSSPARNARAVERLRASWPGLHVEGFAPPHFEAADPRAEREAHAAIRQRLIVARPDFVVLGLGADKEHRFAACEAAALDGIVQGMLCFGGAIDMASGDVRRAPPAWQRTGLEGLYRVLQQPQRLGRLLRVTRLLPLLAAGRY